MEDKIENAIIERVSLNTRESYLTMIIGLKFAGTSHQQFGYYALYLPEHYDNHELKTIAGDFIYNCLKVAGVNDFDNLVGKAIRVKRNSLSVKAIGHIIEDFWFCPSEKYAEVD